jgi:hypothetical protein
MSKDSIERSRLTDPDNRISSSLAEISSGLMEKFNIK